MAVQFYADLRFLMDFSQSALFFLSLWPLILGNNNNYYYYYYQATRYGRLVSVHWCNGHSPADAVLSGRIGADRIWVYTLINSGPAEIQTPTHWYPIGHSLTIPPPVLSSSSILTLPWSVCAFMPARKNSGRFKMFFFTCLKFGKS